ncbi:hypothetical protein [Aeoliella mucimassa]|uniref:Uncharacterized protein n=1 Tax=Aeoliella mucimassa TaxID=2527972 RepID=A0A518AI15_9BACT|nr:hypothetical protein [Aeoliella mucimassa]QDU54371.1 hypothetical protein Pan181_05520 [Aeoliella mucimassa]
MLNRSALLALPLMAVCLAMSFASRTNAMGGTSMVATEGQPAFILPGLPEGTAAVLNDPARTFGWNSWFSEWPNDVNQYAFKIESTDDVNRLLELLAAIQCDVRQVKLSHLKEPSGLGWVTKLDEGNDTPVVFSVGNQKRIDQWYAQVRKPFGVMEFTAAPVAVPPTLTLFVQNEKIKLDELKIPDGLAVDFGYVPTVFHQANTKLEAGTEKPDSTSLIEKAKEAADQPTSETLDHIAKYLEARREQQAGQEEPCVETNEE